MEITRTIERVGKKTRKIQFQVLEVAKSPGLRQKGDVRPLAVQDLINLSALVDSEGPCQPPAPFSRDSCASPLFYRSLGRKAKAKARKIKEKPPKSVYDKLWNVRSSLISFRPHFLLHHARPALSMLNGGLPRGLYGTRWMTVLARTVLGSAGLRVI